MECSECRTDDAALTEIAYEVEETERIPLCPDCRSEFRDGALVEDVSLVE